MEETKKEREEAENTSDVETSQTDSECTDSETTIDVEDAVVENEEEFEKVRAEKDKYFDQLARVQAEYDNFKKRTQKEKQASQKYKSQDLATELLPAIDNFERALKSLEADENNGFMEGMNMVYRQLLEALKNQGVSVIETVGETFDPNMHHAVMQAEDDTYASNVIVEELQKGYMLRDKVIRPAMVKVNK